MIIGDNREAVISNIQAAVLREDFNTKVELTDPALTKDESDKIISDFLKNRNSVTYKIKSFFARQSANVLTFALNRDTEISGIEKIKALKGGAFITSNHFSPTENTCIRYLAKKLGKKRVNIISQVSNFAMPGVIGYLMNYADTIPLSNDFRYLQTDFVDVISSLLAKNEYILIYPEQEMWFNYRKPRPPKDGAYYYAAKLNVPIISCFVEMKELPELETSEFHKLKYVIHVLDVIYPSDQLSARDNCRIMREKDYELKKSAYEKAYGKALDYGFENSDIAGWTGQGN